MASRLGLAWALVALLLTAASALAQGSWYVAAPVLEARAEPSGTAEVVGVLRSGAEVRVSETRGVWRRVTGATLPRPAWVPAWCLMDASSTGVGQASVIIAKDVNMRAEPRDGAPLSAVLTQGQGVIALVEEGEWTRVRIAGTQLVGYVPAWAVRPGEAAEPAEAQPEVQRAADYGQARSVRVSGLYLRESPSVESNPVCLLGENAIVYPMEVAGEWVHVRVHDGPTGWVSRLYLAAAPSTASSGGPATFTDVSNLARGGINQRMEALGDNQGMVYQDMVNVRSGPSDEFQAIAVMPAGVVFQVLGQSNGWYKARFVDGTEGWVASWLCVANAMPASGGGPVTIVQPQPPPQPQVPATGGQPTAIGNEIARLCLAQQGKPYIWGAESPSSGFDCSGLVYWSHKQVGVSVPRVSFDQFKTGLYVDPSQLIPGDAVFFANTYTGGASHVGIYVGSGYFVHAPSSKQKIRVQPLSDRSKDFCGARRLYVR